MEEKPKSKNLISRLILIALLLILVGLIYVVYAGLTSTVAILPKAESANCQGETYCIKFDARYEPGWAVWELAPGLPFSLSITTAGFTNGQALTITCPIDYKSDQVELLAKFQFLFQRQDAQKCRITAR
jgi:hypothetical protein